MGYETRGGKGGYYYRKIRTGNKVRSVYVPLAEAEAAAQEAQERAEQREAAQELRAAVHEGAGAVKEAHQAVRRELAARLQQAGYHQHKRQWRKKRTQ